MSRDRPLGAVESLLKSATRPAVDLATISSECKRSTRLYVFLPGTVSRLGSEDTGCRLVEMDIEHMFCAMFAFAVSPILDLALATQATPDINIGVNQDRSHFAQPTSASLSVQLDVIRSSRMRP